MQEAILQLSLAELQDRPAMGAYAPFTLPIYFVPRLPLRGTAFASLGQRLRHV
jgi:hypothetical protein